MAGQATPLKGAAVFWIEAHENGRRLYFRDWRIHHYHAGLAAIAVGVLLILRDLSDAVEALRRH